MINQGETNRRLPKMFVDKKLRMIQIKLHALKKKKKGVMRCLEKQMRAWNLSTKSFYHGIK